MIDIKWIRENPDKLDANLSKRGIEPVSSKIIALDENRRELIGLMQQLQHSRRSKAQDLSVIQDKNSPEFQSLKKDAEHINAQLHELNSRLGVEVELEKLIESLPNILNDDVPLGRDENFNKPLKTHGKPKENGLSKHHQDLGQDLGMLDTRHTTMISGSRFATLTRDLAALERALVNFMIDHHTKELDFIEVSPPYLVKDIAMYNVGLLPKFADDSFAVSGDFRLIPTGEVSLTNMVANQILPREALPIRMVAHTPCFRSEAGSAGRDTRGLIRMHQFSKVELVSITASDESEREHDYITSAAEDILKKLDLPYRIMLLCSGDTGFQSSKTYDIEVWMPAQSQYREISSCSNCTDFQARRMKARYKEFDSTENKFVHTLNGSGLPIGRTIAAILENYQNEDGSIQIPDCLVKYMGGKTRIEPVKLHGTIIN
jgi:seryl-tRNA synthetase